MLKDNTTRGLFNHVREHLLKQNVRSSNGTICCYRFQPEGGPMMMCAVGCLITDEVYKSYETPKEDQTQQTDNRLEGHVIDGGNYGIVVQAVIKSIGRPLESHEVEMLRQLQSIHDTKSVDKWAEALNAYGKLTYVPQVSPAN